LCCSKPLSVVFVMVAIWNSYTLIIYFYLYLWNSGDSYFP
jgi:hypothetical protein